MTTATDEELDHEWLTADTTMSRWRVGLIVACAAALVFLGGVQTQKHLGHVSSTSSARGLPSGFPSGIPAGFGGGAGAVAGAGPSSGAGSATGSGAGSGTGSTTDGTAVAAVIGTVVSVNADAWTVKDLGGKVHQVRVTSSTPIRQESALTADQVKAGQTVTVDGTKDSDGGVAATKITVR